MGWLARRDDVLHRLADAAKRLENAPPIGWRPLVERYIDGEVRIHVHLGQARGDDPWTHLAVRAGGDRRGQAPVGAPDHAGAPDLCWTYEWPRRGLGDHLERDVWNTWERFSRDHITEFDGAVDKVKVAVLVDVPEFIEHGQGFTIGGVLPAEMRLKPLERCSECRVGGPHLAAPETVPTLTAAADRERDVPPPIAGRDRVGRRRDSARGLVGDAEVPGDLVERGPQPVDDIADDRTPQKRGRLFGGGSEDDEDVGAAATDQRLAPKCWLGFNYVGLLSKSEDHPGQRTNVFIRPVYLGLGV